jgi:hypothetical protein
MADKNVQVKLRNGTGWDNIYPRTKSAIVLLDDGVTTVSTKLTEIDSAISGKVGMTEVNTAISNVVNSAPAALDTLNELANALGDDANFAATMTTNLSTKAPLESPNFTGVPTVPTAVPDTITTQVATTSFVIGQAATAAPPMNGVAAVGVSKRYARQDHVHPSDSSKAPLASPALTGTPSAPTAAINTNTTQIATTAFAVGQAKTRAKIVTDSVEPTTPDTGDFWFEVIS